MDKEINQYESKNRCKHKNTVSVEEGIRCTECKLLIQKETGSKTWDFLKQDFPEITDGIEHFLKKEFKLLVDQIDALELTFKHNVHIRDKEYESLQEQIELLKKSVFMERDGPFNKKCVQLLADYLERHESEIALEINDFGDLLPMFVALIRKTPAK